MPKKPLSKAKKDTEFDAFGKSVPLERRSNALRHIREMGVGDTSKAWECIGGMAQAVERDQPYEALQIAARYVDLTGAYRLLAALCT